MSLILVSSTAFWGGVQSTQTGERAVLEKVPIVLSWTHSSGLTQAFRSKGSDPNFPLPYRLPTGIYPPNICWPST